LGPFGKVWTGAISAFPIPCLASHFYDQAKAKLRPSKPRSSIVEVERLGDDNETKIGSYELPDSVDVEGNASHFPPVSGTEVDTVSL